MARPPVSPSRRTLIRAAHSLRPWSVRSDPSALPDAVFRFFMRPGSSHWMVNGDAVDDGPERCLLVVGGSSRLELVGAAQVTSVSRLGINHFDELGFRRTRRRRVIALHLAVAHELRRVPVREIAILVHAVRVAVPPLRSHGCLPAVPASMLPRSRAFLQRGSLPVARLPWDGLEVREQQVAVLVLSDIFCGCK